MEQLATAMALTLVMGIGAQWLAWKLRWPAILLLLLAGLVAGPGLQFLRPEEMFGDALIPMVSLAVAVILFEGGLSLKLNELKDVAGVVARLATIGAIVTGVLGWLAGQYILGLPTEIAVLLGAILTVTGPTVIIPLLRTLRATPRLGSILKWEGIVIDPIGAMLAVLAFEAVVAGHNLKEAGQPAMVGLLTTIAIGVGVGIIGAVVQIIIIRKFWVPDFLQNAVVLMFVMAAHTLSNMLQPESGLFAVTIMGVFLANQTWVNVRSITEFKESLRVIFISSVFIILAASISRTDLMAVLSDGNAYLFLLALLVIRPISVFISTIGKQITWPERLFLSAVAPRGIVAAAISSVFALRLMHGEEGAPIIEGAERLGPIVFFVVLGTVMIYGTLSVPIARKLGVTTPKSKGVLIVGAQKWARQIAGAFKKLGFTPTMVDSNAGKIAQVKSEGFASHLGSVFDDHLQENMVLSGIGWVFVMTSNDSVNTLAAKEMTHMIDRAHIYQLQPARTPERMAGRVLFGGEEYSALTAMMNQSSSVEIIELEIETAPSTLREHWGKDAVPMFAVRNGDLIVFSPDEDRNLLAGDRVAVVIKPDVLRPLPMESVASAIAEEPVEAVEEEAVDAEEPEETDSEESGETTADDGQDQLSLEDDESSDQPS
jgi:NhaP-type Na+/H+ or K+/H+ antiporter